MAVSWEEAVAFHYGTAWLGTCEPQTFEAGRALQLPAGFTVLSFCPTNAREFWTYATCGMSQPGDANPVELHMFAPYRAPQLVELLYAVAHFHRAGAALELGHTVNFGKPWIGASACTHGLVSLPYLDGQRFETAKIDGQAVKVYWLLPITPQELAFKKARGLEALEDRFGGRPFRFATVGRDSMV